MYPYDDTINGVAEQRTSAPVRSILRQDPQMDRKEQSGACVAPLELSKGRRTPRFVVALSKKWNAPKIPWKKMLLKTSFLKRVIPLETAINSGERSHFWTPFLGCFMCYIPLINHRNSLSYVCQLAVMSFMDGHGPFVGKFQWSCFIHPVNWWFGT